MPGVSVERYERADDLSPGDAADFTAVFNAVQQEWVAGERPISIAAFLDVIRAEQHWPRVVRSWLARDHDGRVIGISDLSWRDDGGPPSGGTCRLMVHPDARGQGGGRALWSAVIDAAIAEGRTGVGVQTAIGSLAEKLCREAGLAPDMAVEQNRCATDEASEALLESWVAAGEAADGYSLVRWDGRCPDELAVEFLSALEIMNDAPREDVRPALQATLTELRGIEYAAAAGDEDWWVLAVRHDASDRLVGLSEMTLCRKRPWIAFQGDTGVEERHRGHRLGAWMKAVNHLRLRRERPQVELVQTWNASSNEPMLRINRALGYRPVQHYSGWQQPLNA